MSSIMDGLNSVSAVTAQIEQLQALEKSESTATTPDATLVMIEQNFNQMLSELIYSSDDDDDEENNYWDSFMYSTDQLVSGLGIEQVNLEDYGVESDAYSNLVTSSFYNTSGDDYLSSLINLQNEILALQDTGNV